MKWVVFFLVTLVLGGLGFIGGILVGIATQKPELGVCLAITLLFIGYSIAEKIRDKIGQHQESIAAKAQAASNATSAPATAVNDFDHVQRRIEDIADAQPVTFTDTALIDEMRYRVNQRKCTGLTPPEIQALEEQLGVKFPKVFRQFLRQMGKDHGSLWVGTDCDPAQYAHYRQYAEELCRDSNAQPFLTKNSVVFQLHQGYIFCYFEADDGDDPTVYSYMEGAPEPKVAAATFSDLVSLDLEQIEEVNGALQKDGGYEISIKDGIVTQTFSAKADPKSHH